MCLLDSNCEESMKIDVQEYFQVINRAQGGINSVGDCNSLRVGVVFVVVVVCSPFLKTFTMGFLLNALSYRRLKFGMVLFYDVLPFNFLKN